MVDIAVQKEQKAELHSKLWEMANNLRGNMEAYEFKNYILGLIFYRYLSERTENYMKELLKDDGISYAEAWEDEEYREGLKEESIDYLGYVIEPKYLFSHVIKLIETGEFDVEYMEKIINFGNLRSFCYTNAHLVGEAVGIAISFFGLGGAAMYSEDPVEAKALAGKGIAYIIPYYDPWCWMNRQAVDYVDEIVDVIVRHYGMNDPKIVSSGGSMGGLSSIVYAAYARITPVMVVSNCPVCDLPYHYTERPDLPRTLMSAFSGYDMPLEDAIRTASPLHLAGRLPDTEQAMMSRTVLRVGRV